MAMLSNLLLDLGLDSDSAATMLEKTRLDLEVKQESMFQEFETARSTLTVPSSSNRINSPDSKFPPGLKGLLPVLNDAKRQVEGLIGARIEIRSDSDPIDIRMTPIETEVAALLNDTGLVPGEDICLLPERPTKQKK
jgi:hypothetical protein